MKPHERLKKVRMHLGMTQVELARRLHIRPPTYSQMENGHHGIAPHILYTLRTSLRVNDEYIREGTGEMMLPPTRPHDPLPTTAMPVVITEEDFNDAETLKKKVRQLEAFVNYTLSELNRYRKIVDVFVQSDRPIDQRASQD